jgi:hypothetical protein
MGTDEVWGLKWQPIKIPQGDPEQLLDYLRRIPWVAGWLLHNTPTEVHELCILNPHWGWRWSEAATCCTSCAWLE